MNLDWAYSLQQKIGPSSAIAESAWSDVCNGPFGIHAPFYKDVLLISDWGGEHEDANYHTFSLLIAEANSVRRLISQMESVKTSNRVICYKKLNDLHRRRDLYPLLNAADSLIGLSLTVAYHKRVGTVFAVPSDPMLCQGYDEDRKEFNVRDFEKMLRTIDIAAFFSDLLVHEASSLHWLMDEDSIVDTPSRRSIVSGAFRTGISLVTRRPPAAVNITTIGRSGSVSEAELISAIPDLCAGATTDTLGELLPDGMVDLKSVFQSFPPNQRIKIEYIMRWLRERSPTLTKLIFVVDRTAAGKISIGKFVSVNDPNPAILLPQSFHIQRLVEG